MELHGRVQFDKRSRDKWGRKSARKTFQRTYSGWCNKQYNYTYRGVYFAQDSFFSLLQKFLFFFILQDEENYTESSKKKKYDRAHAYDKASLDRIQKAPEKKVLFVKVFKYFSHVDELFLGAKKLYNSHCMSVRNDIV